MRYAIALGILVGMLGCGSVDSVPDGSDDATGIAGMGGGGSGGGSGTTGTGGTDATGRGGTTGSAGSMGGAGSTGTGGSTPTCPENSACNGFHDTSFGVMSFPGTCHNGDCCMGCWDGTSCHYEGEKLCAQGMHGGGAACTTCAVGSCKITQMGNYLCM